VAIYWLQISSVQRSAGRRATASAAYRAGERVRDERSGELHNHTRRRDVLHAEIFLPPQFDGVAMPWARSRERLWNTAEHTEKRYNARVAREFQVSLPAELDAAQRLSLARSFAQEIAARYHVAVDLAVHAPRAGSDPRHFHAHLLTTTREVAPLGLGPKAGLDLSARERRRRDLPDHRQEFISVRERWASLTNQALRDAHLDVRVDHRSLAAQGIDREPQPHIPLGHLKMEQRGIPSELAASLRAGYRARVQARAGRAAHENRAAGVQAAEPAAAAPPDVETVRRQAREAWLRLRAQEAGNASLESPAGDALPTPREDLAL
jgi:ATP-dependent exoDNAse (exonuclease V) alpha subunit